MKWILKNQRLLAAFLALNLIISLTIYMETSFPAATRGAATETSMATPTDISGGTATDGGPTAPQNSGSISGFLWNDGDGTLPTDWNGAYDAGESPLAGYTVYLYASDDAAATPTSLNSAAPIAQTQTGENGTYIFEGLAPGNYIVGLGEDTVDGSGYLLPEAVTADSKFTADESADPHMAFSDVIVIGEGTAAVDINAGMRLPQNTAGSISGFLWADGNGTLPTDWNGLYDGGEQPLAGYTVTLYAADDRTEPVAQIPTDANGAYKFEGLAPGNYVVGLTSDTVNGIEYLLPMSATAESKFTVDWSSDPLTAFSGAIEIGGMAVENVNAGMRLPMGIAAAAANPAPAQVIWNYPSNIDPSQLTVSAQIALDQMNWNKKNFHSFYDNAKGLSPAVKPNAQAYTAATSKTFNGYSTPDHVVLTRTALRFLGYGQYNNLDLLYTEAYSSFETLDFTFKPTQIRFHTLNQSGFLFNGSFTGANYTGYALVLDAAAQVANNAAGTAALKLVYINNQPLNATGNNTFPSAGIAFASQDTIIPTIVEGKTPNFHVQLVKSATGFALYIDGKLVREVEPAVNANLPGFGFFTGYYAHACKVLTVLEYSDLAITVKVAPATTSPIVKFLDKDTGTEIADAQTAPSNASVSYVNDEYMVDTASVQTITGGNGTSYAYVSASVSDLSHIIYKAGGAANNTVILYYKDAALLPEKHAGINGKADDGTAAVPVTVSQGDIIDYRIDVKVPQAAPVDTTPIVFGPASLTGSDSGYTSATGDGSGGAASFTFAQTGNNVTTFPSGTRTVTTPNACVESIRRQGQSTSTANTYQHYLWLTTNSPLPAGSYQVTITVAADARTWDDTQENSATTPTLKAFMRGIVGGADTFPMANYNKAYGYSTFTDQIFPADAKNPLSLPPVVTAAGRITFRDGHTGLNTNNTAYFANTNKTYAVPTETTTFINTLTLDSAQPAVIGLVLGAQLSGNFGNTSEHYTSMMRVFKVVFTPLAPPPAPYDVTDLLPDGLALANDSTNPITISNEDGSYTGAGSFFTTMQDPDTGRQQLSWSFPGLPGGTVSIYFKASVTTNSGVFENYALVTNKSSPVPTPDQTNSTWHAAAVVKVTEQYQNILNGETLQGDTYTWLPAGGGYGAAPGLRNPIDNGSKTYQYCAYSADGGATIIYGVPPDGQPIPDPNGDDSGSPTTYDYLWNQVPDSSRSVILYFIPDVQITINSVDHNSANRAAVLRTWVDYSVPGGVPYIMPASQLNSFDVYNYVNVYDLNHGAATAGVPPTPAFSQTQMYGDNEITLDFAKDPMIKLKFVEDGKESHILNNPMTETVPYGSDYDPAQSAYQPLPDKLTDPMTGYVYPFVGYRLDNGSNIYYPNISALAAIAQVDANHTYTLLYAPLTTTTLTISKTVDGMFADLTKQFTFALTFIGADGNPLAGPFAYTGDPAAGPPDGTLDLTDGAGKIALGNGQNITLQDIPADCSVQITETPDGNYDTTFADSESAVTPDPASPNDTGLFPMTADPRTIAFTNTRVVPPPTGISPGGSGAVPLLPALALLALAVFIGKKTLLRKKG